MRRRPGSITAALAALALCVSVASAEERCASPSDFELRGWVESGAIVIVYRSEPAVIEIGRPFAVEAIVCVKDPTIRATGLSIDAFMPKHRHGMNYRAEVSAKGSGRYVAEGMLFHMPGRWRFLFDVEVGGRIEHLWQDIVLE